MQHQHLKKPEHKLDANLDHNSMKQARTERFDVQCAGLPLYLQRSQIQLLQRQLLQRQPLEEEEEEPVQTKPIATTMTPLIQRQDELEEDEEAEREKEEEEEPIQTKPTVNTSTPLTAEPQRLAGNSRAEYVQTQTSGREPAERGVRVAARYGVDGAGTSLPHLDRIQTAFGSHDVTSVRAHTSASAAEACDAIGAQAYATGNNVAFRGVPDLQTAAHEAAHVIQQRAGVQLKGGVGQVGDRYEQNADAVADEVVGGGSVEHLLDQIISTSKKTDSTHSDAVQHRKIRGAGKTQTKVVIKVPAKPLVVSVGKQRCLVLVSPKGITTTPDIFIHYHGWSADYMIKGGTVTHKLGHMTGLENEYSSKVDTKSGSDVVVKSIASTRANLIALLPQGNIGEGSKRGGRMPEIDRMGFPKFVATILAKLAKTLNVKSLKPGKIGVSGHSAGGYEGVASTLKKAGALKNNITEVTLMDTAYSQTHFKLAEKWLYSGSSGKSLRIVGRIHQVQWRKYRKYKAKGGRPAYKKTISHHPWFGSREIKRRAAKYPGFKATNVKVVDPNRDHKSKVLQHTKITKGGKLHADVLVLRTEVTSKKTHGLLRDQFIDDALRSTGQGMAGTKYFGKGGWPKAGKTTVPSTSTRGAVQRRKAPAALKQSTRSPKQYNTAPYHMVTDDNALLRTAPPRLGKTRKKIPQFTRVKIIGQKMKRKMPFIKVTQMVGTKTVTLGWTAKSNVLLYNTKMSYRNPDTKHRKFVKRVVKKAGVDPKKYFADFRNITFLGRPTRTPIYRLLADHLMKAETNLMVKHGRGLDPTATGTKLGLSPKIEMIRGVRPTSKLKSMHLFGLAIDLDYTHNPHIGRFPKKKQGASRRPKSATEVVLPQASLLVTGKRIWWRKGLTIDQALEVDRIFQVYFSYLDKPTELAAALSKARRSPWRRMSAVRARREISGHLRKVSRAWGRKQSVIKSSGVTNYKKELIKGIGLYWLGAGIGDMMHFDMRKTPGLGKKIGTLRYTVSK